MCLYEARFLHVVKHKNIINMKEAIKKSDNEFYLVLDYHPSKIELISVTNI